MRIVTANVNGIRAAAKRDNLAWLKAADADVISLQEVRANRGQLEAALEAGGLGEYHVFADECVQRGRAGVALLSRQEPVAVRERHLPGDDDLVSGRWLEVDLETPSGPLTAVSAYFHSGEVDTPKQDAKYAFLDLAGARMAELGQQATNGGPQALISGDVNIAHREVDIKNWKGNLKKSGFLPEERAHLDRWFDELGWVDLGRLHGGEGPGPYTWWSWRGQAFDNDAGWRIDYHIATPELAKQATAVTIGRAPSYAERWSDHAPVLVEFDFS